MNGPKRIIMEYEDGTRRETAFASLSKESQAELAAIGSTQASGDEQGKGYLLLQWQDGWQEVVAVDERAVELLRYYTIERVEEIGRLSLELAEGYPQLLMIKRMPRRIERILFVNRDRLQAYALEEKATVKEGGKIEHILYDKKRPNFRMEDDSASSARYAEILASLKAELEKRGESPSTLLKTGDGDRARLYKELSQSLGLRGTERQQDVYGFLKVVAEKLSGQ